MQQTPAAKTPLRERRRRQTAASIRRAAIDLAHQHGLDQVTTEMISEAAGISPRTFFNYYPFKEAALAPPEICVPESHKLGFVQGKGNLLADLADFLGPMLSSIGDDRETLLKAHQIGLAAPKLLALQNAMFQEFEGMIASLLAARLGRAECDIDVQHMSAVVAASVRTAFALWINDETLTVDQAIGQRLRAIDGLFQV